MIDLNLSLSSRQFYSLRSCSAATYGALSRRSKLLRPTPLNFFENRRVDDPSSKRIDECQIHRCNPAYFPHIDCEIKPIPDGCLLEGTHHCAVYGKVDSFEQNFILEMIDNAKKSI